MLPLCAWGRFMCTRTSIDRVHVLPLCAWDRFMCTRTSIGQVHVYTYVYKAGSCVADSVGLVGMKQAGRVVLTHLKKCAHMFKGGVYGGSG